MIRAYLKDAATREVREEAVKEWLKNLEEVAYEAENLFDELEYERIRRKVEINNQMKRKICFYFSFSNPLLFRCKMARKINEVNQKLKTIKEDANTYGLTNPAPTPTPPLPLVELTDSISVDPIFVGRENDKFKIKELLMTQSNEVISVIPIVGMGGLGKTTLARQIFNHEEIVNRFEKRIWVCVSENFDSTKIFRCILESLGGDQRLETRETILKSIQEILMNKKYLLVLDDLWNESQSFWDSFHSSLVGVNTNAGNFILVTTRNKKVASTATLNMQYELEGLPDDLCWSIIERKAFPRGGVPEELEIIGKKIAHKCVGHPLAANMVGGTLQGKGRDDWISVLEGAFSDSDLKANNVDQVLKISYNRLPSPLLQKCFAYCSIFPKDGKIYTEALVQLWMANGFLNENEGDMERQGKKAFEILFHHSFFQEAKKDVIGNIRSCKMHDLVHDLALSISDTKSLNDHANYIGSKSSPYRYMVIKSLGEEPYDVNKEETNCLRTLFWRSHVLDQSFQYFKGLHILVLDGKTIKVLKTLLDGKDVIEAEREREEGKKLVT